jgi:poly(hydroxyalkanoate) granule-associated protein
VDLLHFSLVQGLTNNGPFTTYFRSIAMVTKVNKSSSKKSSQTAAPAGLNIADAIRDSAQQIWQAGLGAFAKAQEGRSKVFDSLVQEGLSMQRKTQAVAEERLNAATSKVSDMASDITAKATGQWDKLESIFEERVAKALKRLGLPSASELAEMQSQLAALTRQMPASAAKATRKPVVKKAVTAPAKAAGSAKAAAPAAKKIVRKATKKVVAAKKAVVSAASTVTE